MQAVAYSQVKGRWVELMDRVADDRTPVVITRDEAPSVVLMSLEEYESFEETAYLLRSPKNARRLLESIAELEQGGGQARELAE
ncbi:MAG: type II toxin-antitoxin system prevent-host-death family antitoxin [Anaerolineae bacterium]|nr:type II toxin-antitoxin system prevent-host-death family antitoxin [Anaerolineae bacterium]MCB0243652.1 type II toxin-antitoxin system prevent-host-death family antitoxin [Anaerolineae bacterium]MCB1736462.1 type II toxin-antitoxin system prevent-host-death family antitoxin [Gammaproteobacteria bacterium]MCB9131559.1 type II toxin-antitoxin system prevent-host-death family antitoxin [Anaerolineales bacterium]MCO5243774.1 type II toxin-antitoxin system prevent-host-death family antitoxin [Ana